LVWVLAIAPHVSHRTGPYSLLAGFANVQFGQLQPMPNDKELNLRDAKLVQWLSEANAKESELEADLTAHIALTDKATYKKRLQQHLKETREHKRATAKRIKELGGEASGLAALPEAVGVVAGKTVAAVKGQVGVARALVTSQPETHLRNAQEELREEHVEIAIYTRLETLATAVGDRDTAQLAKRIRREEERMAKFLDAELQRLVKEVVRLEIPRDQRTASTTRRRSTTRSRSGASASSSRTKSRSSSAARSTGSRSAASSRSSGSRSSGSKASGSKTSGSRSSGARASSSRSSGSRSTSRSPSGSRRSS
jgi:ferritin-like metal-binding protein YciE